MHYQKSGRNYERGRGVALDITEARYNGLMDSIIHKRLVILEI
jgi:hypothetical protein